MGADRQDKTDEAVTVPGVRLLGMQLLIYSVLLHRNIVREVVPHILIVAPALWQAMMIAHNVGLILGTLLVFKARAIGGTCLARLLFVRIPFLGGVLVALGTLLAWGALAEVFFWQIQRIGPPAEPKPYALHHFEGDFHRQDFLLGLRTEPCAKAVCRATIEPEGIPLFEATYTSDEHGNRVVPQSDGEKSVHLAAFGCSFMFGDGVDDDETLPAQLACLRPETAVYCFAQSGYGPGQPVLQIASGATDCIREARGAAVYLFMSDHINRLLPRPELMPTWTGEHPAFQLDAEGVPQFLGGLRDVYEERLQTYAVWQQENFVRWSGLRLPLVTWPQDYELAAALLDSARQEYQHRFPGNEFYVLIDPVTHVRFNAARMIDALRHRGVKVLDPKGLYGDDPWNFYHYAVDRHPQPEAHALLAEWFWKQFPNGLEAGPQ